MPDLKEFCLFQFIHRMVHEKKSLRGAERKPGGIFPPRTSSIREVDEVGRNTTSK